jgi:histone acetyltransferase (RNA polymerase elongator complex component)
LPNELSSIAVSGLGEGTSIIRELHVYGDVEKIGTKVAGKVQHYGFGKQLMQLAEHISQEK